MTLQLRGVGGAVFTCGAGSDAEEAWRTRRGLEFSGPANHVALEYMCAVKPGVRSDRGLVMS